MFELTHSQVARISITLPSELLMRFDDHTKRVGYKNRSKAVQDAMQSLITESKWMCEKMGTGVGAIAMVYDHEVKGLEEELTDIQHHFEETIRVKKMVYRIDFSFRTINAVDSHPEGFAFPGNLSAANAQTQDSYLFLV